MRNKLEQSSAMNPNPALTVEKDGTILYSNKGGEPLLREWGVRVGEKLPSSVLDLVQKVISWNSPEKMEVKVGKKVYLIVFHPSHGEECVNISVFDISKQEELEEILQLLNNELEVKSKELSKVNEALRKSESKYWDIINNAQEGIWSIDKNDRTVFVNHKMSEMLGYSVEEILGQGPQKFLASEFLTVADDRLREHRQRVRQSIDYRFIRKDGSDLWCIVSTHQLFDDEGNYAGSLGMLMDITERKKAEEALKSAYDNLEEKVKERTLELENAYNSLKESEERLAEAQRVAHIGSYDWDITTNEEYWSDELYIIFGLDPQFKLNHNSFLNRIHPEDLEYVNHAINEALNKKPYGIDYRIILPGGEERVIYSQGGVIFDEKNIPIRMRGIVQDITEIKKVEESLASIETARKKEIHHKIKNNLQVISSLLDLQAEQFKNKKDIKDSEVLEAFRESQDRVTSMALIHEELHEGEGADTVSFSLYLEKLVDNLFKTYSLGKTDITLSMDLGENLFFDMDTAVPLGMIVNELVSNSLKYAFIGRDKGEIQIKLLREKDGEYKRKEIRIPVLL